jgi:hypothetical protein
MVVDIGSEGTYDTVRAQGMFVIKEDTTYKMWYAGYDGTNYRIIYCTSTNGTTWSNHQMVVNISSEGTYDTKHAYGPFVIKDGSIYRMWYAGHNNVNYRTIYCTSSDGVNWSNYEMFMDIGSEGTYDTSHIRDTYIIKDGLTYKMWYAGSDGTSYKILQCISNDGADNNKKLMITTSDGTTPCYTEIEGWDAYSELANLWIKAPTIVSGTDTELYLYYDKNQLDNDHYVGDVGELPAREVWDDSFIGVWHLSQDPTIAGACIKDSTSSANDGTPNGSMNINDLVDAKIGKGLDFDGGNDYISAVGYEVDTYSIGGIMKRDGVPTTWETLFGFSDSSLQRWEISIDTSGYLSMAYAGSYRKASSTTVIDDQYYRIYGTYDGSTAKMYVNGQNITLGSVQGANPADDASVLGIAERSSSNLFFEGILDEVQVCSGVRSPAWIKADYYNCWNNFITFGEEENEPLYYWDGYVKEYGQPVSRLVRLYNRDTGLLIDSDTSRGSDGYYYLTSSLSGTHFITAFDDDIGDEFNALILDKLSPKGAI